MRAAKSSQNEHPIEPKYPVPDGRCPAGMEGKVFSPAVDIQETDSRFVVMADIPGATSESTDVRVEQDEMILTARVEAGSEADPTSAEYPEGHWFRRFNLSGIEVDEVEAALQNGVLTVRLPKKGGAERRKIDIN